MATLAQVLGQHELIGNLVGREIRGRYKQSVLGMAWSVVTPLVNTLLFTFLFAGIAGFRSEANAQGQTWPYPLFVYTGMMFWNFFSSALVAGTDSMTSNLQLLTRVYFPREVFVLSALAARSVDFLFSLIVMGLMCGYYGIVHHFWISPLALLAPLILLIQAVLILGLSFGLATINLFYRDARYVVNLLLQVWLFLTPVAYSLSHFQHQFARHPAWQWAYLHLNPMTPLVLAYQDLILNGRLPDWGLVGVSGLISLGVLAAGYALFARFEWQFAEAI